MAVADLGNRSHVDGMVEAAVPAPGQPVDRAQVVGPDRPLEPGSPADQAQPVTGAVHAARAGPAEGLNIGFHRPGEAIPAAGAQAAGVWRLQLAARDPAHLVAEQRMVTIWGQGLGGRIPAGRSQ